MQPFFKEEISFDETKLAFKCFTNSSSMTESRYIDVQPHWHEQNEILFVKKGSAKQHINGNIFMIRKGDIVIIKEQDIHGTWSYGDTDIIVIQFSGAFFKNISFAVSKSYEMFCDDIDLSFPINCETDAGIRFKVIIDDMIKAYEDRELCWELDVISDCTMLIKEIIKEFISNENKNRYTSALKDKLKTVFEFTARNYTIDIRLSDVAALLNYSVPHFCRIFKDCMGMGYHEYLTRFRTGVAAGMLKEQHSVTDTAMACGFLSVNSFIRVFKLIMGITPGKYKYKANAGL